MLKKEHIIFLLFFFTGSVLANDWPTAENVYETVNRVGLFRPEINEARMHRAMIKMFKALGPVRIEITKERENTEFFADDSKLTREIIFRGTRAYLEITSANQAVYRIKTSYDVILDVRNVSDFYAQGHNIISKLSGMPSEIASTVMPYIGRDIAGFSVTPMPSDTSFSVGASVTTILTVTWLTPGAESIVIDRRD